MTDTTFLTSIIAKSFVVVLGIGYSVLAFLVCRQVSILSRILGTNLVGLLKLLAILHLIAVLFGSVFIFFLI